MSASSWKARLRWLPNAITLARFAGIPVLVWLLVRADGPTATAAGWWFGAISITDFIDGKLARALGAESKFGQIMDPLVDRLVMAVGLIGLLMLDRLPWPGPAFILARDALAVGAFVWLARRGVEMRVDWWGKASSSLAMLGTGLCMLSSWPGVDVIFWLAVAVSVATLANYTRTAARQLRVSGST